MTRGGTRRTGGGAATAGGMDFQHRVASWVAVQILAEKDTSPPWDLPASTTLEFLRCESEQPVDDLLVGTSSDGFAFLQIKKSPSLSANRRSDLASALDQFVRQFLASRLGATGTRPWERPLETERDRLVLVIGPNCSAPIREHLPNVLRRFRGLAPGQSIQDASCNQPEVRALGVVLDHIRRSWQVAVGALPQEEELRELVGLIRIWSVDVATDGTDERGARDLLRRSILRDSDQSNAAWTTLITACSGYASNRSGADRTGLQKLLLDVGFSINVPRSYRCDCERLRDHTAVTAGLLSHLAEIRVGSTDVKVRRRATEELRRVAEEGSILVVGEPGAGKSGVLHDFVEGLLAERRDIFFLAVDQINAGSLGELRAELGLSHEVIEVLRGWPGNRPAFLVIDALDAARTGPAPTTLRNLIRIVLQDDSRWRVVASIRKFDLRYSTDLRRLFWTDLSVLPAVFTDHEFARVRHVSIPNFDDGELHQISTQSTLLGELLSTAPQELLEILRSPFNLNLAANLLEDGVDRAELHPIRTQLELLDQYWLHRVIPADGLGDAREGLLRIVCEEMVARRMLRASRSCVREPGYSLPLNNLLSSQVLAEWRPSPEEGPDRYVLTFSHHVLFDYAVARLLLRSTAVSVGDRLMNGPDLAIVIRPSLLIHFRHLWTRDRDHSRFWDAVLQIAQSEHVPHVGRIIGPSVAAELGGQLSDFVPLCLAIESESARDRSAAELALRYLVGALLAAQREGLSLVGPNAGPWCGLLERLSRDLRAHLVYTLRSLLAAICERPESFTPEQRLNTGRAARRLLEFGWDQSQRDRFIVMPALQAVCRTCESDPEASAAILRRALRPDHLAQHAFEELGWIAREINPLIRVSPDLVEEIYCSAFEHEETSDSPTSVGGGHILSLTSTRKQDYEAALDTLAREYPRFLSRVPVQAIQALVSALHHYAARRHGGIPAEDAMTFDFHSRVARILPDNSGSWDASDLFREEPPLIMLNSFQSLLERLIEQEPDSGMLDKIIDLVIEHNHLSVLWRRLLLLGAKNSATLGHRLRPLAWSVPVLMGSDTTKAAGQFLKAIYPRLSPLEKELVERAILSITVQHPSRHLGRLFQDRLLACLSQADLVTDEARLQMGALEAAGSESANEEFRGFPEGGFKAWGEREALTDQGAPLESDANRRFLELEEPVKDFVARYLNLTPVVEDVAVVLPALQALWAAIHSGQVDGVHPTLLSYAWGYLAAACARAAEVESLSCLSTVGALVKAGLLEASRHEVPAHDPNDDDQFDKHPTWGEPAPRIEAAGGLPALARHPDCLTHAVLRELERLSEDPVPAVRYQIAVRLRALYETAREVMWRLLERICGNDQSRGVLRGILDGPLPSLAGQHPDRVANLVKGIFDRVKEGSGAKEVRDLCVGLLTELYVWRDHNASRDLVAHLADAHLPELDLLFRILRTLRVPLTYGPINPDDANNRAIRQRAFYLMERILLSTLEGLGRIGLEPESARLNARVIDDIGSEIYIVSGAFQQTDQDEDKRPLTRSAMERFYHEASSLLDELASAGLPSVAHHLLETLEAFIELDPRGVFLRIGQVVRSGEKWGYQHEELGADLIVKLVERYLAEYRLLLAEDDECRQALLDVLNIFVQAGWPSTWRLTYRLDEIFR